MKAIAKVLSLTLSFTLASCGGGSTGGGADTPPAPVEKILSSTIVSQTVLSNYAPGTPARDAFDYLNVQRVACGFGSLDQSVLIDAAAQAHSNYLKINNLVTGHYEDKTRFPNGFTGVNSQTRIMSAGYSTADGAGSEVIGFSAPPYFGTSIGRAEIMNLFLAPYHGNGMLQGDRDVGIGFNPDTLEMIVDFAFSNARPKQLLRSDVVATYPCNGTTGVLSKSYADENPTPITGRNLQTNPIGHPIYLKVRDGQILNLSSFDLRKVGSSSSTTTVLVNKGNANANLILDNSSVIIIPTTPLDPNTTYSFAANGTNTTADGKSQPLNVNFTFSTGAF